METTSISPDNNKKQRYNKELEKNNLGNKEWKVLSKGYKKKSKKETNRNGKRHTNNSTLSEGEKYNECRKQMHERKKKPSPIFTRSQKHNRIYSNVESNLQKSNKQSHISLHL